MKILIGCEESQVVCKAFRERGFEAYSCDILSCSGGHPEWHLCMDIFEAIKIKNWDFIGIHPVCTAMALSGNRTYALGKDKHSVRLDALESTIKLWATSCQYANFVYMENPMGVMNKDIRLPKPQIVQPYYFGDEYQKTTCLWLHRLPPLFHAAEDDLFASKTHTHRGEMVKFKSGKIMPKWFADTPSTKSEKNRVIRSKTFPGIAKAMADQWGNYLLNSSK